MSKPGKTDENSVISIRDLRKSFGDLHVLQGSTWSEAGRKYGRAGAVGYGKVGFDKNNCWLTQTRSGSVIVLGQDVQQFRAKEMDAFRQKVGFSFQSSALYDSMSIRENLEFPLVRNVRNLGRADIDKAVEKALDDVGLSQTINQMPSELSGGQRKRIGIARTLILNPEIMLYDEPTSGLDPLRALKSTT